MDTLVEVTFTGPVKTSRGWHKRGDRITVTMEEARALDADGSVSDITVPESVVMEGFDEAVAARVQALADAMVAPLEARIKALEAENAELKAAAKAPAKTATKAPAKSAENKG